MDIMRTTEVLQSYWPADPEEICTWANGGQVDRIVHDMLARGGTTPWEELPPEVLRKALGVTGQRGSDYVVAAGFSTLLSHAYSVVVHRLILLERHLRHCHRPRCGEKAYSYDGLQVLELYERAVEQFLRLVKAYIAASKSLDLPDLAEVLARLGGPLATAATTDDLPEGAMDGQAADVPAEDTAMDASQEAPSSKTVRKRGRPLRRSAE